VEPDDHQFGVGRENFINQLLRVNPVVGGFSPSRQFFRGVIGGENGNAETEGREQG
jgi:hypothetical protein